MLMFFLFCSLVLFLWSSLTIDKQMKRNRDTEFLLFTKKCDNSFDSIFKSSKNIKDFFSTHYLNVANNKDDKESIHDICEFIASQQTVLYEVIDVFVFDEEGNVYTKDGLFDLETIYYSYFDVTGNDFETWNNRILSFHDDTVGKISLSSILTSSHVQTRTVEYMKYYEIKKHPIVILYDIDMGKFFGDKYRTGSYGVIFQDNTVYPEDELMTETKNILAYSEDRNIEFDFNNTKYAAYVSTSNTYACRYIYVQQYKYLIREMLVYCGIFALIIFLFSVVAYAMSLRFSKHTYLPIKSIVDEISSSQNSKQDELRDILAYFQNNKRQIDDYNDLIRQYSHKMQAVGVERILTNSVFSNKILLERYKIDFNFENYLVAIIRFSDNFSVFDEEFEGIIAKHFCNEHSVYYYVITNNMIVGIINCDNDFAKRIHDERNSICESIDKTKYPGFEMVISSETKSIDGISKKYKESLEKIGTEEKYKIIAALSQGIENDKIDMLTGQDRDLLTICIKCGDIDNASQVFKLICNKNMCYQKNLTQLRILLNDILVHVLRYHNGEIISCLAKLEEYDNTNEMIAYTENTVKTVAANYEKVPINKKIEIQFEVLRYINENLYLSGLSITSVSDMFCISPSYASKQFKSVFEIGLLEYMQKTRINESLKLLMLTNSSVKEVSNSLGFVNDNVFIRVFKKYIGTTPGDFREKRTK